MLLEIKDLVVTYHTLYGRFKALDRINLSIESKETVAIVGESGSGKSTMGLSIVRLLPPNGTTDEGKILVDASDITKLSERQAREMRGKFAFMIFQDPLNSLNPVRKIGPQMDDALRMKARREGHNYSEAAGKSEVIKSLEDVRLPDPKLIVERYPHQLSGGQIQRVVIAMSLLMQPRLLIADEPTSALDVTVQAQVLRLMSDLKKEYGMSILFITHDISVAYNISERIGVMYSGQLVEVGKGEDVIKSPRHPYTKALIASMPTGNKKDGKLNSIAGAPPNMFRLPSGCRFHPRCSFAMPRCQTEEPQLEKSGESEGKAACWLYS